MICTIDTAVLEDTNILKFFLLLLSNSNQRGSMQSIYVALKNFSNSGKPLRNGLVGEFEGTGNRIHSP